MLVTVDGSTPIMPPFLLVLKATNTSSTSQDSMVEPIRSSTHPYRRGTSMECASQPQMPITTNQFQPPVAPKIVQVDGGSTIVTMVALRAKTFIFVWRV